MSVSSISVPPSAFKKTLVYYYMPGCPYCLEFEPVFMELATRCQQLKTVSLKAVDITRYSKLNVPVKTVPSVIYFDRLGRPHRFEANSLEDRTLPKLARFLVNKVEEDFLGRN